MALAGKELGTDVGCWFGPSVAAGAIKWVSSAFIFFDSYYHRTFVSCTDRDTHTFLFLPQTERLYMLSLKLGLESRSRWTAASTNPTCSPLQHPLLAPPSQASGEIKVKSGGEDGRCWCWWVSGWAWTVLIQFIMILSR